MRVMKRFWRNLIGLSTGGAVSHGPSNPPLRLSSGCCSPTVCVFLLWGDGQAIDTKEFANAGNHQNGPIGVNYSSENEVGSQIPELKPSDCRAPCQANAREVNKDRAT